MVGSRLARVCGLGCGIYLDFLSRVSRGKGLGMDFHSRGAYRIMRSGLHFSGVGLVFLKSSVGVYLGPFNLGQE